MGPTRGRRPTTSCLHFVGFHFISDILRRNISEIKKHNRRNTVHYMDELSKILSLFLLKPPSTNVNNRINSKQRKFNVQFLFNVTIGHNNNMANHNNTIIG